jgi:hypothetical protein
LLNECAGAIALCEGVRRLRPLRFDRLAEHECGVARTRHQTAAHAVDGLGPGTETKPTDPPFPASSPMARIFVVNKIMRIVRREINALLAGA